MRQRESFSSIYVGLTVSSVILWGSNKATYFVDVTSLKIERIEQLKICNIIRFSINVDKADHCFLTL